MTRLAPRGTAANDRPVMFKLRLTKKEKTRNNEILQVKQMLHCACTHFSPVN